MKKILSFIALLCLLMGTYSCSDRDKQDSENFISYKTKEGEIKIMVNHPVLTLPTETKRLIMKDYCNKKTPDLGKSWFELTGNNTNKNGNLITNPLAPEKICFPVKDKNGKNIFIIEEGKP